MGGHLKSKELAIKRKTKDREEQKNKKLTLQRLEHEEEGPLLVCSSTPKTAIASRRSPGAQRGDSFPSLLDSGILQKKNPIGWYNYSFYPLFDLYHRTRLCINLITIK